MFSLENWQGIFNDVLGLSQSSPPLQEIIFAICLSFTLNLLIAAVYKQTYSGKDFSQDYVHSLLILGTVVSVVVMVVKFDQANAQATAFGIFAAFSIIRFRTDVSAARDIGFLFCAMAAGLGVGARAYVLATATTVLICAIIYVFSRMDIFAPARATHRLRVRVTNDIDYDTVFGPCFERFLHDYDLISVESIQAGMMTELRYSVQLKDVSRPGEFVAALQQLNGNNRVMITSTGPARVLAD
ncbi:MAG: DUF4956 domain-containing protein [Chthoniobacteraceae bacterium]